MILALSARNIVWHHCPINDCQAPDFGFEVMWSTIETKLLRLLYKQRRILLHCAAGLGRTGTMAAKLLIASGVPAPQALARVRAGPGPEPLRRGARALPIGTFRCLMLIM
ncbi:MAG: hypothetical protein Ct9H300mP13_7420 [Gammaproteobacteria bacterium]|nr:MAG: hypothetical protein Ct9H300mP13_7420 [Gammaproteobacteria bacterium]